MIINVYMDHESYLIILISRGSEILKAIFPSHLISLYLPISCLIYPKIIQVMDDHDLVLAAMVKVGVPNHCPMGEISPDVWINVEASHWHSCKMAMSGEVPSGNRLQKTIRTTPFLMGKPTNSMTIFNRYVTNYWKAPTIL